MKIPEDMVNLPVLTMPVQQMKQADLRSFIPQMIRTVTGREKPGYGNEASRPEWWPKNLTWSNPTQELRAKESEPFTESLRNIVTSCYKYHGQEHLLKGDPHISASPPEGSIVSPVPVDDGAFINGALLQTNKAASMESARSTVLRPVQLFQSTPAPAVAMKSTSRSRRARNDKTFVEIFICFFCEREFKDKPQLQRHQQECNMRPMGSNARSPSRSLQKYVPPVVIPRKKAALKHDPYVKPRMSKFIEGIGLLPKSRAAAVKKNTSVECDFIDLTQEEAPKVPITPKSPRTLMSQLSRDMSPTATPSRLSLSMEPKETVNEESSDSEAESEKSSSKVSKFKMGKVASLLQIDLSSPLGQRLQKHIVIDKPDKTENSENVHYEHFCRTPKKSDSLARLRHRKDMFPNTFRRKRTRDFFYHMYKFNKKQRKEFEVKMITGLTKQARRLLKLMKPCRVRLENLSESRIDKLSKPPFGLDWKVYNAMVKGVAPQHSFMFNNMNDLRQFMGAMPGSQSLEFTKLLANQQGRPLTLYQSHMPGQVYSDNELFRHLVANQLQQNRMITPSMTGPGHRGPQPVPQNRAQVTQPPSGPLTSQDLQRGTKRRRDDDVISISSNESDDGSSSGGRRKKASSRDANPAKKAKHNNTGSSKSQTVLFKCHLCAAEILFSLETTEFIRKHFADKHGVHNIRIMEQKDRTGQLVLSIVEDPPGRPSPHTPGKSSLSSKPNPLANKDKRKPNLKVSAEEVICIDD